MALFWNEKCDTLHQALTWMGGGSSLWPQKRWELPNRAGDGPPIGVEVEAGGGPTRWVWGWEVGQVVGGWGSWW
jgi:hypothetical protein